MLRPAASKVESPLLESRGEFLECYQAEVTLVSICETPETMAELVAHVLHFAYFDKILIDTHNIQSLLLAANYFQVGICLHQAGTCTWM